MTQLNSIFPQVDPIMERRRALAKVYALLIRLAEEAEAKRNTADEVEEKASGSMPASEELSNQ